MYHWPNFEAQTELVDATFENAAVGIAYVGLDGSWLRVNRKLLDIVGYEREELLRITFQDITHPDDVEADVEQFKALQAGDIPNYQMEKRYYRKDGELIWINLTVAIQRDDSGLPQFAISVVEDISERKANEEALAVVINELNHRVKNTLATVQAVAHMSFRKDEPLEQARADFTKRLNALAGAHDLLTDEKWAGASVLKVVQRALSPFEADAEEKFAIDGPDVKLAARPALTLAMAIHELATNALKYGALSVDGGKVSVKWTHDCNEAGRAFQFDWIERGGPPTSDPIRQGFGTTLLTRILPGDFGGIASAHYGPKGLHFRLNSDSLPRT